MLNIDPQKTARTAPESERERNYPGLIHVTFLNPLY